MLDLPSPMFSDEIMGNTDILLVHTMGAGVQFAVAAILVRALYLLRRNGDAPRGFVSIAVLMSLGSLSRVMRLAFTWTAHKPPLWLDSATAALLFTTVLAIPVILSVYYLPIPKTEGPKQRGTAWLQRAMATNIVCSVIGATIALYLNSRNLASLIASMGCTISAILLCVRASLLGNLQIRQRGLLLFSVLTTAGLVGISAELLYGYLGEFKISGSIVGAAAVELGNLLVALGMMFVFANLRLADVIVKRVVGLYIWVVASLLLWSAVTTLGEIAVGRTDQKTGLTLLAVVLTGAFLVLTPMVVRRAGEWIDSWVFQVPDFDAAVHGFWERLLELEGEEEVYRAGEEMIRNTLSLSAVEIVHLKNGSVKQELTKSIGPNPRFLAVDSPLRNCISPPADALLPLFRDGSRR